MSIAMIVLLGPPGSGKGTQAKELVARNPGWIHISTGDLFRAEINSGSELGKSVKSILDAGHLVSDAVTDEVFQSQVKRIVEEKSPKGLLLDGYPRTEAQARSLIEFAKTSPLGLTQPLLIEFRIDGEEVVKRLSDRLINPRTGRIYHRVTNPPKNTGICDDDGGPLMQRPDDRPDTIRDRIKLYEGQRDAIVRGLGKAAGKAQKLDAARKPNEVAKELLLAITKASEGGSLSLKGG